MSEMPLDFDNLGKEGKAVLKLTLFLLSCAIKPDLSDCSKNGFKLHFEVIKFSALFIFAL